MSKRKSQQRRAKPIWPESLADMERKLSPLDGKLATYRLNGKTLATRLWTRIGNSRIRRDSEAWSAAVKLRREIPALRGRLRRTIGDLKMVSKAFGIAGGRMPLQGCTLEPPKLVRELEALWQNLKWWQDMKFLQNRRSPERSEMRAVLGTLFFSVPLHAAITGQMAEARKNPTRRVNWGQGPHESMYSRCSSDKRKAIPITPLPHALTRDIINAILTEDSQQIDTTTVTVEYSRLRRRPPPEMGLRLGARNT